MKPIVFVLNPHSGRGRAIAAAWQVERAFRDAGLPIEVRRTLAPGHAVEVAREAAPRAAAVLGIGGDGTLHEVVNGVLAAAAALGAGPGEVAAVGAVPIGTGNDFVKSLGMSPLPEAGIAVARAGRRRRIDAGRLRLEPGGPWRFFVNQVEVGYGATVVHDMAAPRSIARRFLSGHSAYVAEGVYRLTYRSGMLALAADGIERRHRYFEIHIGNGRFCGGGISFVPAAEIDDGLLDLMTIDALPPWRTALIMLEVNKARPVAAPGITRERARRVLLRDEHGAPIPISADGEAYTAPGGALEVEVIPGAIDVLAP